MPSKTKSAGAGIAVVSEDAIRQRAYFLWEADGRPDGRGEHYWHLAQQEATRSLVEKTAKGVARATKGKSSAESPPKVKPAKAGKAKLSAAQAKPPKKAASKPRAAVPTKKAAKAGA